MRKGEKICFLIDYFIKITGIIFQGMFFYIFNANFENSFAEGYFNNISDFNIVRSFGISAVYFYMLGIASIISNGSSFYDSGYLQKLINSHKWGKFPFCGTKSGRTGG